MDPIILPHSEPCSLDCGFEGVCSKGESSQHPARCLCPYGKAGLKCEEGRWMFYIFWGVLWIMYHKLYLEQDNKSQNSFFIEQHLWNIAILFLNLNESKLLKLYQYNYKTLQMKRNTSKHCKKKSVFFYCYVTLWKSLITTLWHVKFPGIIIFFPWKIGNRFTTFLKAADEKMPSFWIR